MPAGMQSTTQSVAYVGLGSNLGDPAAQLARARAAVAALPASVLLAVSPLYRTEPQGLREQPFFLNQVVSLQTGLAPLALLEALLDIEKRQGRVRGQRFGPRTLDLDLLLFGDLCMSDERLALPHPRMLERAFVLLPLADIAPNLVIVQDLTVREALGRVKFTLSGDIIHQPCVI